MRWRIVPLAIGLVAAGVAAKAQPFQGLIKSRVQVEQVHGLDAAHDALAAGIDGLVREERHL